MLCYGCKKSCRACFKEVDKLNDVGLCVKCRSFDNLTKEQREQVKEGARCIDVINKTAKMSPKLALKFKWDCRHVVPYDYEGEMTHDQRNYIQRVTSIVWCHRLQGSPQKGARVFHYRGCDTYAYFVEQRHPALPMIEQLIQCP